MLVIMRSCDLALHNNHYKSAIYQFNERSICMKKFLSLFLSMVLLLTIIPMGAVSVSAATELPAFCVQSEKALAGSEVSVDIVIKNNPGIASTKLKVAYDADALELVTAKAQGAYASNVGFGPTSRNPFTVNWVDTRNDNYTDNGVFATLTFKVKDDVEAGSYPITISYAPDDVYNINFDNVYFDIVNGNVYVVECLHTDVTLYDAVESTCIAQGHDAYVYCNECENVIEGSDERYPLAAHKIDYCSANEATHTAEGNKEYWQCSVCGTCFADANGNSVIDIKDVIIEKIPHVYDDIYDVECECGYVRKLVSISVDKLPTKSVYLIGQSLCSVGMVVTANYDDGTTGAVEGYTLGAFDAKTAGVKKVAVAYGGLETEFEATVLSNDAAAFVVEDKKVKTDGTFTVGVSVVNNPGILSAKLLVGYDSDVLELVGYNGEGSYAANVSFGPETNNPFIVNWVDTIHGNNTEDGVIVTLTFRVKDPEALGKTVISVSYDPEDVYDENYDNVDFETVYGVIEITKYTICDVNDDGKVNNKDLGLLMQYLNGWDVQVIFEAADLNGDGKVNNKDYGLLMQKLNGWDIVL